MTPIFERAIPQAEKETIKTAAAMQTLTGALRYLKDSLPGWFIYKGGNHIALHLVDRGPRYAMITGRELVGEICLYGNSDTGAGWLAKTKDNLMLGTGEPRKDRTFTAAVYAAAGGIEEATKEYGYVRIFAPGGERYTEAMLDRIPPFGELVWQPAEAEHFYTTTIAGPPAPATP